MGKSKYNVGFFPWIKWRRRVLRGLKYVAVVGEYSFVVLRKS
jgi:hypothetical protein